MFKKSLFLLVSGFSLLLCSCVSVDYTGPTYTPTKKIDVFYGKEQIKKPYKVMGKATGSTWYTYQSDSLIPAIIAKAKECGADAVLIDSITEKITAPTRRDDDSENTPMSDDDMGEGIQTEQHVFMDNEAETESIDRSKAVVEFLKYTK